MRFGIPAGVLERKKGTSGKAGTPFTRSAAGLTASQRSQFPVLDYTRAVLARAAFTTLCPRLIGHMEFEG